MRPTTVPTTPLESPLVTRGLLFDLYGTLVEIGDAVFQESLPGLEGISRREWVEFQRDTLLVRPFASREAFVGAIFERFGGSSPELAERLLDLLGRELESVRPMPGARSVLAFLDRRGMKLGLITNSASLIASRWTDSASRRRSTASSSRATPAPASPRPRSTSERSRRSGSKPTRR